MLFYLIFLQQVPEPESSESAESGVWSRRRGRVPLLLGSQGLL